MPEGGGGGGKGTPRYLSRVSNPVSEVFILFLKSKAILARRKRFPTYLPYCFIYSNYRNNYKFAMQEPS